MKKASKASNIGKWFEDTMQELLDKCRGRSTPPSAYLRLYDTHSARGKFLPPQPGDFMVSYDRRVFMIELKASNEHESLRGCLSSNVKEDQVALMRIWMRPGNPGIYFFYSNISDDVEAWDAALVCSHRVSGKPLPKCGWLYRLPLDQFEKLVFKTMDTLKENYNARDFHVGPTPGSGEDR